MSWMEVHTFKSIDRSEPINGTFFFVLEFYRCKSFYMLDRARLVFNGVESLWNE